jgi:hypothetical protein
MLIDLVMCRIQGMISCRFFQIEGNLSSFYLMQLNVILNVLMSLGIGGVVELKDSDVEQCHHYCSFCACCHVYYVCCLV